MWRNTECLANEAGSHVFIVQPRHALWIERSLLELDTTFEQRDTTCVATARHRLLDHLLDTLEGVIIQIPFRCQYSTHCASLA